MSNNQELAVAHDSYLRMTARLGELVMQEFFEEEHPIDDLTIGFSGDSKITLNGVTRLIHVIFTRGGVGRSDNITRIIISDDSKDILSNTFEFTVENDSDVIILHRAMLNLGQIYTEIRDRVSLSTPPNPNGPEFPRYVNESGQMVIDARNFNKAYHGETIVQSSMKTSTMEDESLIFAQAELAAQMKKDLKYIDIEYYMNLTGNEIIKMVDTKSKGVFSTTISSKEVKLHTYRGSMVIISIAPGESIGLTGTLTLNEIFSDTGYTNFGIEDSSRKALRCVLALDELYEKTDTPEEQVPEKYTSTKFYSEVSKNVGPALTNQYLHLSASAIWELLENQPDGKFVSKHSVIIKRVFDTSVIVEFKHSDMCIGGAISVGGMFVDVQADFTESVDNAVLFILACNELTSQ